MKILIAVPTTDMVPAHFAQSLVSLKKVGECAVSFSIGSLVYDARNQLAAQAIEKEADYVMWFDSDMIFNPDTLERLLAHDKDFVCGMYFRRRPPYTPTLFKKLRLTSSQTVIWEGYEDYPDHLFQIEGCGFGCVLMKTDMLIDIAAKYGNGSWFSPIANSGEDCSFCIRAKEQGYELWCDPTIPLGHIAQLPITEGFYTSLRKKGNVNADKG